MITKSRIDRFESRGETIRVTGKSGHVLQTDVYIKRKYKVDLRHIEADEKEGDFVIPDVESTHNLGGIRPGHLPEIYDGNRPDGDVIQPDAVIPVVHNYEMNTTGMAINKSIDGLNFYPLTSQNSLDVKPSTQAALLPYLCEKGAVDNMMMTTKTIGSAPGGVDSTRNTGDMPAPEEYRYPLSELGGFLIKTVNADRTDVQLFSSEATHFAVEPQAAMAAGTCLVHRPANADIYATFVPMRHLIHNDAGAVLNDGSQFHPDPSGAANISQKRFTMDLNGFQLRLRPDALAIPHHGGVGIYTGAVDNNLRFDLGEVADRIYLERFDVQGYSTAQSEDGFDIPIWRQNDPICLVACLGRNQGQVHASLQAVVGIERIDLRVPIRRFSRGKPEPAQVNAVFKSPIPRNPGAGALQQPYPPQLYTTVGVTNNNSVFYANWNERNEFSPIFQTTIRASGPTLFTTPVGRVYPRFQELDVAQVGYDDTRRLIGMEVDGALVEEFQNIEGDNAIPGATPFIMMVTYDIKQERQLIPAVAEVPDPDAPEGPPLFAAIPAHHAFYSLHVDHAAIAAGTHLDSQNRAENERHVIVVFTKAAIQTADGEWWLDQTARYAPFGIQANGTVFAPINRVTGVAAQVWPYDFGKTLLKLPSNGVGDVHPFAMGNRVAETAGRNMHQFFRLVANERVLTTVADPYYEHLIRTEGAFHMPTDEDEDFEEQLFASLSGTAHLFKIPDTGFFTNQPIPIRRNQFYGSVGGVELEEPLLGFSGMSVFQPSDVFPIYNKLPPFIQDFNYVLRQYSNQSILIDRDPNDPAASQIHIDGVTNNIIAYLSPLGNYGLTVRSEDGFDQTTKELQTAAIPYPLMESYTGVTVTPPFMGETGLKPLVCECQTAHGPPDFVFLRIERQYRDSLQTAPFEPTIKTLKMNIRFQDVKTVSDLDSNALYQVTRRNSNFRSDTVKNYQTYGAVLFRKRDLGNWSDWDGEQGDPFQVEFIVSDYDVYHPMAAATYPGAVTDVLDEIPLRLSVVFIYRNYGFSGKYHECKFDFQNNK